MGNETASGVNGYDGARRDGPAAGVFVHCHLRVDVLLAAALAVRDRIGREHARLGGYGLSNVSLEERAKLRDELFHGRNRYVRNGDVLVRHACINTNPVPLKRKKRQIERPEGEHEVVRHSIPQKPSDVKPRLTLQFIHHTVVLCIGLHNLEGFLKHHPK